MRQRQSGDNKPPPQRRRPPQHSEVPNESRAASSLESYLVSLQRTVGNGAVACLLQAKRSVVEPAVQRLVEWDTTKAPPKIAKIEITRLPGSGGGAHTTAYQLFSETVQNALFDTTFPQGIARLEALFRDVKDLPGYDSGDASQQSAASDFINTVKVAKTKLLDTYNHTYWIEQMSEAWIRFRNALDYNYLPANEGDLKSWGEPGSLIKASAAYQKIDWANIEAVYTSNAGQKKLFDDFIVATAKLLDTRNVTRPTKAPTPWDERWRNIVQQHIASIIASYPGCEEAETLIVTHLLDDIQMKIGMKQTVSDDAKDRLLNHHAGWSNIESAA